MSAIAARAPARVNLIGEHTDYNDGFVMPAAIGYETHAVLEPESHSVLEIVSETLGERATIDLSRAPWQKSGTWSDYARGVLAELLRAGVRPPGGTMTVSSTVPVGAGLSSSASFEVAVALALLQSAKTAMPALELARLAQRAENEYTGTRSGIMDQFAVLFGKPQRAMMLDTRSMEVRYVAVPSEMKIVVCNTMVRHSLAGGEYNRRRAQCEAAVAILQRRYPAVRALRDVTMERLEAQKSALPEIEYRRARHVVGENERVLHAAAALESGDLETFGKLMNASHDSLRDDYEVSCPELDLMVEIARGCDGVYGARMTGGGFGGCTVNAVRDDAAPAFRERVAREYRERTGVTPQLYDGTPVAGASYD